ncbi:rod shape-determining protein MreD [Lactobacillus sp. DCY120]|uniref:Rod shape-determining protein MreD n=1 Tax=Bombilactobacillus apium TaxID=2675299 RepID=A0A850QYC5_9LACO|nr:rod shape-determining protein MreD [Bombilactobacillus apium]
MADLRNRTTQYIVQFLILLLAFFLDGSLKNVISFFNLPTMQVSLQLLLLVFIVGSLHDAGEDNHWFYFALIIGILYDSYYSHIFGLYTVVFPLTVIVNKHLKKYLPHSLIFEWSVYFIFLTISMIYLYLVGSFLNLVLINVNQFIVYWLAPSLLFNSLFFGVLYFPLAKLSDKLTH